MPFCVANGIELYHEVTDFTRPWEGDAETLVFLHGLHGHLNWWNWFQTAFFSQHYRVVTFDQRGHGRSFKPAGGYSIEVMASDLREVLRHLNIARAHVVGASMGGMVGLQFALVCPDILKSLVLVDSYPYTPVAVQGAIQQWIEDTRARGYAAVMETFNRDYAAALFSPAFWTRCPEFPAYETRFVLDNLMPDLAFIGACEAIQRFDVFDRLGEIEAPVLVIAADAGMAYEEGLRMQQAISNAQLWTPPNVGHSVQVEMPEEFNHRVLQFLRSVRG